MNRYFILLKFLVMAAAMFVPLNAHAHSEPFEPLIGFCEINGGLEEPTPGDECSNNSATYRGCNQGSEFDASNAAGFNVNQNTRLGSTVINLRYEYTNPDAEGDEWAGPSVINAEAECVNGTWETTITSADIHCYQAHTRRSPQNCEGDVNAVSYPPEGEEDPPEAEILVTTNLCPANQCCVSDLSSDEDAYDISGRTWLEEPADELVDHMIWIEDFEKGFLEFHGNVYWLERTAGAVNTNQNLMIPPEREDFESFIAYFNKGTGALDQDGEEPVEAQIACPRARFYFNCVDAEPTEPIPPPPPTCEDEGTDYSDGQLWWDTVPGDFDIRKRCDCGVIQESEAEWEYRDDPNVCGTPTTCDGEDAGEEVDVENGLDQVQVCVADMDFDGVKESVPSSEGGNTRCFGSPSVRTIDCCATCDGFGNVASYEPGEC